MRQKLCFYELPRELRDYIYDFCAISTDKTTVCFARGEYLPPNIALTTRRIREEFLPRWNKITPVCAETKHIRLAIFNLGCKPVLDFWDKAVAYNDKRGKRFESVRIVLAFTEDFKREGVKGVLRDYNDWLDRSGRQICDWEKQSWEILDERRFGVLRFLHTFMGEIKQECSKDKETPCPANQARSTTRTGTRQTIKIEHVRLAASLTKRHIKGLFTGRYRAFRTKQGRK